MADVLLTHSYHLARDAKQFRKMQPYPPLGTLYAATALRSPASTQTWTAAVEHMALRPCGPMRSNDCSIAR